MGFFEHFITISTLHQCCSSAGLVQLWDVVSTGSHIYMLQPDITSLLIYHIAIYHLIDIYQTSLPSAGKIGTISSHATSWQYPLSLKMIASLSIVLSRTLRDVAYKSLSS